MGIWYVDSLLDAKFSDKNIKGGVQDVDNASLVDNGSVSVGEIGHKETKEKMR